MRYVVSGEFTKISETTGTIQNMSNVYAVEVSNKAEADSGIILYPFNRISVTLSECYLRCVDGGNAEVRVVPFEVDVTRGGGSSAAGTSNLTDVFRSLEVIDGKVNFYGTTDKSGDILASFNLPEEIFLNQVGTIVVHDFMFSALAYPNSTNPNLDGKTVLVLAVKGDKKTNPTIKYVFVDLQKLVDKYLASNKSININGYSIAVNISDDTENLLALKEDGLFVGSDDSKLDKVPSAVQDNIPVFDVEGTIIDGGLSFADLEYELPTASVTTKGGVKVGSGLAITGDTLNVTISGGESYSDFTGATSIAGGVSGLVPAPAAGDESKFLRGDGSWSGDIILPTVPSSVDGGLWLDVSGTLPVPKFFYGGANYSFGGSSSVVEPSGGAYAEYLTAYLPFDSSATEDTCGNTWTVTGTPTVDTSIKKFGAASVHFTAGTRIDASNILDINAEKWTFDTWVYAVSEDSYQWGFGLGTIADRPYSGIMPTPSYTYIGNTAGDDWAGTAAAMVTLEWNNPPNVWEHIALVKDGSSLLFFKDGVLKHTHTLQADIYDGGMCHIGAAVNSYANNDMYFSRARFFEGVALWTSDFTPPTESDY